MISLLQFGIEGEGFEPILDALFGMRGFFTEILSRSSSLMYLDVFHRLSYDSNRMKRQVK